MSVGGVASQAECIRKPCNGKDTFTIITMKTYIEIKTALLAILEANNVKVRTKQARTIECSFIQGLLLAVPQAIAGMPLLSICLMCDRSVLDLAELN